MVSARTGHLVERTGHLVARTSHLVARTGHLVARTGSSSDGVSKDRPSGRKDWPSGRKGRPSGRKDRPSGRKHPFSRVARVLQCMPQHRDDDVPHFLHTITAPLSGALHTSLCALVHVRMVGSSYPSGSWHDHGRDTRRCFRPAPWSCARSSL